MAKPKKRGTPKPQSSLDRGIVSVVLSILSSTVLGAALITESLLLLVVSALSALATVAQVRWSQQRAKEDLRKAAARPKSRPKATTKPTPPTSEPKAATEPVSSGGVVRCTETGRPTEGEGKCDCASRHITSAEGVGHFGRPLGSPLGRRKKAKKAAMTS